MSSRRSMPLLIPRICLTARFIRTTCAALLFLACRDVSAPGTDESSRPGDSPPPSSPAQALWMTLSLPPSRLEFQEGDTVTIYARVVDRNGVNQPSVAVEWRWPAANNGITQHAIARLTRGTNIIWATITRPGHERVAASLMVTAAARPWQMIIWNPDGSVLRIPPPDGVSDIFPEAINDAGQVVGSVIHNGGLRRGFIWSAESGYRDPGSSSPGVIMRAVDINNRGMVTGTSGSSGAARPFIWSETGGLSLITDDPAGYLVEAINHSGHIAGTRNGRPFIWTRDSGFVGGIKSQSSRAADNAEWWFGVALNDHGDLLTSWSGPYQQGVDWSWVADGEPSLWSMEKTLSLDCPRCVAAALNNRREVVGMTPESRRAFHWSQSGGVRVLPGPDMTSSEAVAINELGAIAGALLSWDGQTTSRAAVWAGTSLKVFVSIPGIRMTYAKDINNLGQVLVQAQ